MWLIIDIILALASVALVAWGFYLGNRANHADYSFAIAWFFALVIAVGVITSEAIRWWVY